MQLRPEMCLADVPVTLVNVNGGLMPLEMAFWNMAFAERRSLRHDEADRQRQM